MQEETAILDELSRPRPEKGKLFGALAISSVSYMLCIILAFGLDARKSPPTTFDWQLLAMILILPVSGIIFLLNSKRIGWIIHSFYFLLITSVLIMHSSGPGFTRGEFQWKVVGRDF